ncbi:MAG: carboxypeptidase-like regulatory domain-containing protein [Acidobacteria bacterium]|nr:carboxypeptidase-like regulatory domain-containing protein [Acidobacteriota bacterium]
MQRFINTFFLFLFVLLALILPASAQVPTASVRGLVSDPAQATVPDATVVVKSKETGTERNVTKFSRRISGCQLAAG